MKKLIIDKQNRSFALLGFALILLFCGQIFGSSKGMVVFRDDFDLPDGSMPDSNKWVVNHPESWWWVQGRTFFPSPTYHPAGPFPKIRDGKCVIEHHRYNPYHLGTPKTTFLGGEIHTAMEFFPDKAYCFEARIKCNHYPNGLVTSFFQYGYDGLRSDEIDFEFVTNRTNDDVNYPSGDPVLTVPWNESHQCPLYIIPDGLDLTQWNTFRIYWYPSERLVRWIWIDPNKGEIHLRSETRANCIPDEPMAVYFNFWAPTADWMAAYDASLEPASDPSMNETYLYEIDYVEVRIPDPMCGDPGHPYPTGDLDYDCHVGWCDMSTFAVHWLHTSCTPLDYCEGTDINEDTNVNLADFAALAAHWLESTAPSPR